MKLLLVVLALLAGPVIAQAGESFTLDNVTITSGDVTYRADRLDVTDSILSRDAVQALLADDKTRPSERWSQLSAARIVAPEITSRSSAGSAEQTVTYRDVVLEGVVAGRIGRVRATSAAFSLKTPEGGTTAGRAGAIALAGIDVPGLAHMLVEGRATPDEAARTIIASGTIDAIEVDLPDGGTGRIGKVNLRDAGGRALAVPMTTLVDVAPRADTSPPSPERRRAMSGLAADMLTSQSLGALELSDVEVRAGGADGGRLKATGVSLTGVGKGLIAQVALTGFAIEGGGPASLSFDRFALSGVDLTPVLAEALKEDAVRVLPRFDRIELAGAAYAAGNIGQPMAFKVASATLDARTWRDGGPQAVTIGVDRLVFDLPTDDPRARPLLDLGYSKLDLSLGADAFYDVDKSELALKAVRLSGNDLGSLELSALLGSVGPDALGRDVDRARAAIAASLFRRATATITDGGLLTRLIETQARRSALGIAETRARWASGIRAAMMAMLADNPDRGAIADAAERFVRNGGRISVTADTANGLGLIDAALAGGLGPLLGKVKFSATTN